MSVHRGVVVQDRPIAVATGQWMLTADDGGAAEVETGADDVRTGLRAVRRGESSPDSRLEVDGLALAGP
jgi:hypothetical protein